MATGTGLRRTEEPANEWMNEWVSLNIHSFIHSFIQRFLCLGQDNQLMYLFTVLDVSNYCFDCAVCDVFSLSWAGPVNYFNVYLIDAVNGHIVFHLNHKRAKGPVVVVHSENWVVVSLIITIITNNNNNNNNNNN